MLIQKQIKYFDYSKYSNGKAVYTATALFNEVEYKDVKEEVLEATGHNYENGECKKCTAKDSDGVFRSNSIYLILPHQKAYPQKREVFAMAKSSKKAIKDFFIIKNTPYFKDILKNYCILSDFLIQYKLETAVRRYTRLFLPVSIYFEADNALFSDV